VGTVTECRATPGSTTTLLQRDSGDPFATIAAFLDATGLPNEEVLATG
jgi:hypothetical protein